jgi:hypothetical protein
LEIDLMVKKSDSDYFGTFLDTLGSSSSGPTQVKSSPPVPGEGATLPRVLAFLSASPDVTLPDLASGIGSSLVETAQIVGKLSESGLILVTGDPGAERVSLTDAGRIVAEVA